VPLRATAKQQVEAEKRQIWHMAQASTLKKEESNK
jgi:hypothetical protein